MAENQYIEVKGARVNNLKNIDVKIPRDKLIVITGLSGSGKSSLAFDTLYAEGQRRYVESLSSYARQFLGRMHKPECDFINGLPPAIAIEQKVTTRNPRSTVGTSTEIYDYLRLLFARVGQTISPLSGQEVKKHTVEDVIAAFLRYPSGTRVLLSAPLVLHERSVEEELALLHKGGYTRLELQGVVHSIDEVLAASLSVEGMTLLIDRLAVSDEKETISRLTDSVETAFYQGNGACMLTFVTPEGNLQERFSKRFELDGISFEEPNDLMFSFNSPAGACPTCEGFGRVVGIDEALVIPNQALSLYEDAIVCWRGEKMSEWKQQFITHAATYDFPIHRPYYQLTEEQRALLWEGNTHVRGLNDFFRMVEENQYKIQYRVMLARYRGKTLCPTCKGTRLKPEAGYVQVAGRTLSHLVLLPIDDLVIFFQTLSLDSHREAVAKRLLIEVRSRLGFLQNVGLGYLTLNRLSASLSGGESQRINLATSLGSSLVGSLYILDEPSIGLHPRDTRLLIDVLRQLQALGNTVVVVEHDEEIMRAADYIIDIGPLAGCHGGEVVYQGDVAHILANERSLTTRYLTRQEVIELPAVRRKWHSYIAIEGAAHNNLKGIDVKFPLHAMTVVTGVSGSGKSSLVRDVFYRALLRQIGGEGDSPGTYKHISGDLSRVKQIEYVDQNPIGRSSRSNPATYIKAYDEIRRLYADQQGARQMGFSPAYFSFNVEGGRCEECKGEGVITVEMQFMANITLECEACHGKRFKQEVLEIEYRGKNINDVLEMSVDQAIDFFGQGTGSIEKKIVKRLMPLHDVGLGYVSLGQSSSTLSGGENQRVKLAYFLGNESQQHTLFIFDEPTTGLHFHDIRTLLISINALVDKGHTVVIIEHNMDVIKCADYLIDLGPEGGGAGGYLVATGTPEEVAQCDTSHTGRFLREVLAAE